MAIMKKYQYIFATLLLAPVVSFANVCDLAWDADNIVRLTNAYAGGQRLPLNDRDKHSLDEVTLSQVRAFSVAKERISGVVGLSPKLLICSSKEPNAFAISTENGDVVGVTIGMLKLVDGDQDMAAEIVGHEIAHHVNHHMSSSATSDSLLNILGLELIRK